jgi:hypothetical protein
LQARRRTGGETPRAGPQDGPQEGGIGRQADPLNARISYA